MEEAIEKVKFALRIVSDDFNDQIKQLIEAALLDLETAGVTNNDLTNALVLQAVTTYCRLHFGEPDEFDRLKQSYDEQKAQMSMRTGFTQWTEAE